MSLDLKAIEQAECCTFDSVKYYCPWCGLVLTGGSKGCTHVDGSRAWDESACDYSCGDIITGRYSEPVSTLQVLELRIAKAGSWIESMPQLLAKEKEEKAELTGLLEELKACLAWLSGGEQGEPVKATVNMPKQPTCRIKGDAGTYEVSAIDWLNNAYLVFRSGEHEWVAAAKVTLIK